MQKVKVTVSIKWIELLEQTLPAKPPVPFTIISIAHTGVSVIKDFLKISLKLMRHFINLISGLDNRFVCCQQRGLGVSGIEGFLLFK